MVGMLSGFPPSLILKVASAACTSTLPDRGSCPLHALLQRCEVVYQGVCPSPLLRQIHTPLALLPAGSQLLRQLLRRTVAGGSVLQHLR